MAQSLPKFIVFGDKNRQNVAEAIAEFLRFCEGKAEILANCFRGDCATQVLKQADFAVVFGGDGTILSAARELSETNVPIIGINIGKLGYLAEFSIDQLERLLGRVISDASLVEKRMMLSCSVVNNGKSTFCETAVNDVVITAGPPFSMIEMKITIENRPVSSCVGDGIIISTPTGSTAYNLSAGGPILSANLSAVVITPICPHSLSFRPIVIDAERKIEIELIRVNSGTTITLDGQVSQTLNLADVVTVEKHRGCLSVVSNPEQTQWDTLASKLNWGSKPNYKRG
ncbi:MAG: NAD(+)/NADH kinase [Sedimentisphaerales bacterium]|nr:NAD(+)/NADH kinase [Sedimentisphaerales bacterium]